MQIDKDLLREIFDTNPELSEILEEMEYTKHSYYDSMYYCKREEWIAIKSRLLKIIEEEDLDDYKYLILKRFKCKLLKCKNCQCQKEDN